MLRKKKKSKVETNIIVTAKIIIIYKNFWLKNNFNQVDIIYCQKIKAKIIYKVYLYKTGKVKQLILYW